MISTPLKANPHRSLVADFLTSVQTIRLSAGGVAETSFYPALSELFNAVGIELRPTVTCILSLANAGAGIPDGGFFTSDQIGHGVAGTGTIGQPSRGALEVKPPSEALNAVLESPQVRSYVGHYGQVLVSTLREFALVTQDGLPPETYSLAASAHEFWSMDPGAAEETHGARLSDFVRRCLLRPAPITTPRDLAWILAAYAREALTRLEGLDESALSPVRDALGDALGVGFTDDRAEHFFRSTLVQTLFYGLFSAWVLWSQERNPASHEEFNWHETDWNLRLPIVRGLYERLAGAGTLTSLRLVDVMTWAGAALNRVDSGAFFASFEQHHAVQYFYEPFLEAFDPELRKELGVWYTPAEVVRYMVHRVDTELRETLGLVEGLASDQVYVLDPCCGTGSFLLAALETIAERLRDRGEDSLVGYELKRAACDRLFGFEILPAPLVVAHMQMGLALHRAGVSMNPGERAAIHLTNALTGWRSHINRQITLWPELADEIDAAARVKQDVPVLVVIGNPPYNGFPGVAVDEERELTNSYRSVVAAPKPEGHGLNDLYVRFFRMAERKIVEGTGRGIVCFISNYSWLDGRSFPGMRERYLDAFDHIWVDSLNGDRYRTGKLTPDGRPDPSIFSTEFNREGIQVGTAIATMVRATAHESAEQVETRNLWGVDKRRQLLDESHGSRPPSYERVAPVAAYGYPYVHVAARDDYPSWPKLTELHPWSSPGIKTSRDGDLVDASRDALCRRMSAYFDQALDFHDLASVLPELSRDGAGFNAQAVRQALITSGMRQDRIVPYLYRPLDLRWLYWEGERNLLDRSRPDLAGQVFEGNAFIAAAQNNRKAFDPPVVTNSLASLHVIERGANLFPLRLAKRPPGSAVNPGWERIPPVIADNVSEAATSFLEAIGGTAEDLFFHCVAILHAPSYATENSGALRLDWPGIPLPPTSLLLSASAALGRAIASLIDPAAALTARARNLVESMNGIASITRLGGGSLDPGKGDLAVSGRWGIRSNGAVMPGPGLTKPSPNMPGALDVFMNEKAFWHNVPLQVWELRLGGYQVLKKWLSYRESSILGRPLSVEEARTFSELAKRLAVICELRPELDANYVEVVASPVSLAPVPADLGQISLN